MGKNICIVPKLDKVTRQMDQRSVLNPLNIDCTYWKINVMVITVEPLHNGHLGDRGK